MAKPEHVKVVKRGSRAIKKWREKNPGTRLDLTKADLRGANLSAADLSWADLSGAELTGADLSGANLSDADLSGTTLFDANLSDANLSGAKLFDANLSWANLSWANLSRAELTGADLSGCRCLLTIFGRVDLSEVVGLDSVRHEGPSTIGVDTLFMSRGKIPEVFLRGAGVPDILIEYLGSLTGKALEFYTCFISFTEADDALSRRLYADLQAAGVRCWRWKEDAKLGSTLMKEVDTAVRVYDKLVVILSEASLKAQPVIREIERALQKEQREEGKEVLFPIRVDEEIFQWEHELQADVVRKVIGDFREWQDPTKYDAALKRLIAALSV